MPKKIPLAVDAYDNSTAKTVEGLFNDIRKIIDDKTGWVINFVEYDIHYGYPTSLSFHNENMTETNTLYRFKNLKPVASEENNNTRKY